MTQSAVCEINNCGVLAIGRCKTCNKAFCTSHQAYDKYERIAYSNQCDPCFAETPGQKQLAKRDAHNKEIHEAKNYFTSGSARSDLLQHNIPQIEMYREAINFDHKSGQPKKEIIFRCTGWYLGEFLCHSSSYDSRSDKTDWFDIKQPYALENIESPNCIVSVHRNDKTYEITGGDLGLDWEEWLKARNIVKELIKSKSAK